MINIKGIHKARYVEANLDKIKEQVKGVSDDVKLYISCLEDYEQAYFNLSRELDGLVLENQSLKRELMDQHQLVEELLERHDS